MTTLVVQKKNELRAYLESGKLEIEKSAAARVDPDHLIRLVLTAATKTPKLLNCTMESISLALLTATQLGLEPNGYHAHLVPFGDQCQLIPDYKGLVKLAYRAPNITGMHAAPIYENDSFEYGYGTDSNHFLRHKPTIKDRGELIGAYAVAKTNVGSDLFVVMGKEDIEKRRKASKSSGHKDSPWKLWTPEMYIKTAIKALAKLLPLGEKVEAVIAHENKIEAIDIEYREKPKTTTLEELQAKDREALGISPQFLKQGDGESAIVPTNPPASESKTAHLFDRISILMEDLSMGDMARISTLEEYGAKRIQDLTEGSASILESILSKRLDDLASEGT